MIPNATLFIYIRDLTVFLAQISTALFAVVKCRRIPIMQRGASWRLAEQAGCEQKNNNRLLCEEGSCMDSDNNDDLDSTHAIIFCKTKMQCSLIM